MLKKKVLNRGKRVFFALLFLFVASVFIQGCKSSLDRGKAAKIIAEYMKTDSPAVVEIPRQISIFGMGEVTASIFASELRKVGFEVPDLYRTYGYIYISRPPEKWRPFLWKKLPQHLKGVESSYYLLQAFKNIDVKVTGITFEKEKTKAEAHFQFEWKEPTEPASVLSEICSKIFRKPLELSRFGSPKKGTGVAYFKLFDDGWRVYDLKLEWPIESYYVPPPGTPETFCEWK